jgi:hypothetical protein
MSLVKQTAKPRLVQLFARYIGMLLILIAGSLGIDTTGEMGAQITAGALEIAAALIGVGGLLIDQLIHKAYRGGVIADK